MKCFGASTAGDQFSLLTTRIRLISVTPFAGVQRAAYHSTVMLTPYSEYHKHQDQDLVTLIDKHMKTVWRMLQH